jgi:hypothetical protein
MDAEAIDSVLRLGECRISGFIDQSAPAAARPGRKSSRGVLRMRSRKAVMLVLLIITLSDVLHANKPAQAHCTLYHPHHCDIPTPPQPHYKTNKFDLKAEQEAGGWILAWSQDISETDALQGVVAAGVSIYSGGSSFALWIQNLVQRTIQSTSQSAGAKFPDYIQRQAESLARQVIFDAIQGKSPKHAMMRFDTIDFKAGAIRYTGGNYLGDQLVGPHTWGMKVYLGFRMR